MTLLSYFTTYVSSEVCVSAYNKGSVLPTHTAVFIRPFSAVLIDKTKPRYPNRVLSVSFSMRLATSLLIPVMGSIFSHQEQDLPRA